MMRRLMVGLSLMVLVAIRAFADDPAVQVIKGQRFTQGSASAPSPAGYYFRAAATGLEVFEPVQGPQVQLPSGQSKSLSKVAPGVYRLSENAADLTTLDGS